MDRWHCEICGEKLLFVGQVYCEKCVQKPVTCSICGWTDSPIFMVTVSPSEIKSVKLTKSDVWVCGDCYSSKVLPCE